VNQFQVTLLIDQEKNERIETPILHILFHIIGERIELREPFRYYPGPLKCSLGMYTRNKRTNKPNELIETFHSTPTMRHQNHNFLAWIQVGSHSKLVEHARNQAIIAIANINCKENWTFEIWNQRTIERRV